jgi:hypothetical protein
MGPLLLSPYPPLWALGTCQMAGDFPEGWKPQLHSAGRPGGTHCAGQLAGHAPPGSPVAWSAARSQSRVPVDGMVRLYSWDGPGHSFTHARPKAQDPQMSLVSTTSLSYVEGSPYRSTSLHCWPPAYTESRPTPRPTKNFDIRTRFRFHMERDKWAEAQWSSACLACIRPWLDLKIKKKKKKERKKERKQARCWWPHACNTSYKGRQRSGRSWFEANPGK